MSTTVDPRETSRERADLLAPTLADRVASMSAPIDRPAVADAVLRACAAEWPDLFALLRQGVATEHAIREARAAHDWALRYSYDMQVRDATLPLKRVWEQARDLAAEPGVGAVRAVFAGRCLRLETTAVRYEDTLGEMACTCGDEDETLNPWGPI